MAITRNIKTDLELGPYAIKGRWYKILLNSDGTTVTAKESDLDLVTVANNTVYLPPKFKALDFIFDPDFTADVTSFSKQLPRYDLNSDKCSIIITNRATYTNSTLYVFGYFKE